MTTEREKEIYEWLDTHCRRCANNAEWWKDSEAESRCPMNRRKEVYEGNGYCFLFKPQESEDNG